MELISIASIEYHGEEKKAKKKKKKKKKISGHNLGN
jgi:hypothetical protein